jgi:malate dehydrogenase
MKRKVSIIGAGNVGATTAQLLVQSGIADVVLFDVVKGMPQGKALDMAEACPLWNSSSSIRGTNEYADTSGSDIVVVTAGLARKPGMSRSDLLHANADIIRAVCSQVAETSPHAILIIVTNPMDIMAQLAWKTTKFSSKHVMGMGGVLDAARLAAFLSWEMNVSPEDIEAIVLGGHGDDMVPLPRFTTIKGIPLTELLPKRKIESLIERTRNGGAEIVELLKAGSAYYAPAASTFQMVKSILLDEKRMLPCAAYLNGEYGIRNIYMGVPAILGKEGVEKIVEVKLTKEEKAQFRKSSASVKKLIEKLQI